MLVVEEVSKTNPWNMCGKWKRLKGSWPNMNWQIWFFTCRRPVVHASWVFSPHLFPFLKWGPSFVFCFVSFFFFWRTTSFLILSLCVLVKLTLFHSGFRVGCDSGFPVKNLTLASVTGIRASLSQGQRGATWNFCWACKTQQRSLPWLLVWTWEVVDEELLGAIFLPLPTTWSLTSKPPTQRSVGILTEEYKVHEGRKLGTLLKSSYWYIIHIQKKTHKTNLSKKLLQSEYTYLTTTQIKK